MLQVDVIDQIGLCLFGGFVIIVDVLFGSVVVCVGLWVGDQIVCFVGQLVDQVMDFICQICVMLEQNVLIDILCNDQFMMLLVWFDVDIDFKNFIGLKIGKFGVQFNQKVEMVMIWDELVVVLGYVVSEVWWILVLLLQVLGKMIVGQVLL